MVAIDGRLSAGRGPEDREEVVHADLVEDLAHQPLGRVAVDTGDDGEEVAYPREDTTARETLVEGDHFTEARLRHRRVREVVGSVVREGGGITSYLHLLSHGRR
jgi:hypothetical protein